VDQERERTLRALADLDNARKRAQRERRRSSASAERVLKDLLPVVDNLDRALDSAIGPAHGTVWPRA
jgi:molecular chaperone GrpE